MRPYFPLPFWLIGLVCIFSIPAFAQAGNGLIDQILPAISTPNLTNLRNAEKAWELYDPATADVLSRYAMALAFVANNRHQPAFELMERIPYSARSAGPLRRLSIWLALKVGKEELVQSEMQSLIDELKRRPASAPTQKDLDDMQFAGKLTVYLEAIAEREEPLSPAQGKAWREVLAALPAAWNADLATIQANLTAAHGKREQELKDAYAPWRQKTDQEYAAAQRRTAQLAQQVTAAETAVTAAITAQQTFAATAQPQLNALDASFKQLSGQRSALREPRRPSRPNKPRPDKNGKTSPADEREYERDLREYERDMKDYEKEKAAFDKKAAALDAQINNVTASAKVLFDQEQAHQKDIRDKKADLAKLDVPRKIAEKNEIRLKLLLADRPSWDSPGTLATLRSLDAYVDINLAREVERIQAARTK